MEKTQKKHGIDMTAGSPFKVIIAFALPLLLGNVLQQTYNLTDSIVVGNFAENSDTCLAAVGTSMSVIFLLGSLSMGIGMGASIIISQFFGAKDHKSMKRAVDTIYIFMIMLSIPLTIIGICISRPMLEAMSVEGLTLDYATTYMRIIFLGFFMSFGFNMNSGILQGLGNSKISLLFLGIAASSNIALDLLFVIVFKWGVLGVALATIIAQGISFFFGVFYINKNNFGFKIHLKNLEFDGKILLNMIRLGFPAAFQNVLFSLGSIFLQKLINSYGENFMAAFTSAQKIDSFAFLPILSFSSAITTFMGQNIGAKNIKRAKKGVLITLGVVVVLSIIICIIVLPMSKFLISLFSKNEEIIEYGTGYLYRIMPFVWLLAAVFIFSNALRGAGESIIPLIGSITGLWLARVPAAYIIANFITPDVPVNLYFSFLVGWIFGLCPVLIYYFSGRWEKKAFKYIDGKNKDTDVEIIP